MPNFSDYKIGKDESLIKNRPLSSRSLFVSDPALQLSSASQLEASYIKTKFDQPDLFTNRFDTYFTYLGNLDSSIRAKYNRRDGIKMFVNNLFAVDPTDTELDESSFLYNVFNNVADLDTLAVRCSGITLPGYSAETISLDTRNWSVDLPSGVVNLAGKSSISFRLDKHAALMDLFSAMSGKVDTISLYSPSGVGEGFQPTFATNLWQKWRKQTDPYSAGDLGLCLIVLINPMKRFPILGGPETLGRQYAFQTMMGEDPHPFIRQERTYQSSKVDYDYANYANSFPIFVFENIKIIGVDSDLELKAAADPGSPPDINVSFIYRRFRQIDLTVTQDLKNFHDFLGSRQIGER